jgi:hypothetical protein
MAGKVGPLDPPVTGFSETGDVAIFGPAVSGTGWIAGGCGLEGADFSLSALGLNGGGSPTSGRGFLAGKKIRGQGMVFESYAQFQGWEELRELFVRNAVVTGNINVETNRKQDRLFDLVAGWKAGATDAVRMKAAHACPCRAILRGI